MSRTPHGAIRRAGAGDLDRVAALWSLLAAHHARLDPLFRPRRGAAGEIRALLGAEIAHPDVAVFVCEEPDELAGFCTVRIDRAPPILEETQRAEITDLAVREERRRHGIGRALARSAFAWARERGVARVEVRVASGNVEGQAFWRALGFGEFVDVLHRRL